MKSGKWKVGVAALVCVLALGTAGVMMPVARGGPGPVQVTVPGAISLSIHCGGDETTHANGDHATFTPDGVRCDVEAPLSAVMPLRGQLDVTGAAAYRCQRDESGMELSCSPEG